MYIFFVKQKTAYEMRISDWSSDVCSSDLQETVLEDVGVRENRVGLRAVAHVLLDAEIRHPEIEMECRTHADRGQVGGAMRSGADLVELRQRGDLAQLGNAAGVDHGGPDIVDELALDQLDRKSTRLDSSH